MLRRRKFTRCQIYNTDGSQISKTLRVRDSDGHCLEEKVFRQDGLLTNKYTYKYDAEGNRIEDVEFPGEDEEEVYKNSYSYEFDDIGSWIKQTRLSISPDPKKYPDYQPGTVIYRNIKYWE